MFRLVEEVGGSFEIDRLKFFFSIFKKQNRQTKKINHYQQVNKSTVFLMNLNEIHPM